MFAFIGMVAKLIGALYRIPLTNVMGAEGIGLYQMVFPLYTVLLTVTSGGLPAAVSKVTAGFNAKREYAASRKTLGATLVTVGGFSLVAALVLALGRNRIAFIQGNPLASAAYLGIAPSVFLVGVISCFRGYYQGSHNMLPSALSQLAEQVIKLAAGLYLCGRLLPYGVEFAVLGAMLGVTLSEAAAFLGLIVWYGFTRRRQRKRSRIPLDTLTEAAADIVAAPAPAIGRKSILLSVYKVALPVTLGAIVIPVTQVIDSILVINVLSRIWGTQAATSWYGLLNGPVNSLINMPVVVTAAVSVALLPRISAALSTGREVGRAAERSLKYSLMLALPCFFVLAVFSRAILGLLYSKSLTPELISIGSGLLAIGGLTVVFMAVIQVSTAVLQGADRAAAPAVNLIIGAVVKVLLTVALLRVAGIYGAVAASVACYGITAVLDIVTLNKRIRLRPPLWRTVLAPLLSSAVSVGAGYLCYRLLSAAVPGLYALIAAFLVIVLSYAGLILLTRALEYDELKELPFAEKIFRKRAAKRKNERPNKKNER